MDFPLLIRQLCRDEGAKKARRPKRNHSPLFKEQAAPAATTISDDLNLGHEHVLKDCPKPPWSGHGARSKEEPAHRSAVRALTRAMHEKTLFGDIPFSNAKFDRFFDQSLSTPDQHLGLVVTLGNRVLGYSHCSLGGYFIGEGASIVSVVALTVDPDVSEGLLGGKVALRLTKGIETWAQSRRATHVLYHVTTGTEMARADRFFRGCGMKQVGGNYGYQVFS
ncbi:MAG: hypothetical protein AAF636_08210 [Pseudomonadota bacterium]